MSKRNECPFCGHPHSTIVIPKRFHTKQQVECEKCGAGGPLMDTKREAIDAWNARISSPAGAHVIEVGTGHESLFGGAS